MIFYEISFRWNRNILKLLFYFCFMFESLKKKILGFFKKEESSDKKDEKIEKNLERSKEKKAGKKLSKESLENFSKKVSRKSVSGKVKVEDVKTSDASSEVSEVREIVQEVSLKSKSSEISDGVGVDKGKLDVSSDTDEDFSEKKGFFARLAQKITTSELSKDDFDDFFDEFEIVLLEHNVALEVVDKLRDELNKNLVGKRYKKSEAEEKILESLKKAIDSVLVEPPDLLEQIRKKEGVYVIVFFGINGSGKTTNIAKLANFLKKNNISCVLAAADTFRAASIEQLQVHADALQIPLVKSQYMSDPAAVAFDSIQYAKKHHLKVVLIDTAGRMHTKTNLIREMEKIVRVTNPDLKLFVGEAITGNDVVEQAKTFNESVGIDGIILSKADVDEKAGAVLSVSFVTKKPLFFLGVGQTYDALQPFTKKMVLKNLGLEK